MNRLRETGNLDTSARWRLAAAYALDGKERVAQDLISGAGWEIEDYRSTSSTYGSSFRDKAMILETMTILNNPSAANLLKEISDRLSSSRYFSTQELSYSLIAVSKYANNQDLESLEVSYSIDGGSEERLSTQTKFLIVDLLEGQEQISISNQSGAKLYLSLTSTGVPRPGEERAEQSRLSMTVKYQDREGRTVDPSSLTAGTDFMMIVTVDNDSNEHEQNIALSTIFPAGWEILNTRMDQSGQDTSFDQPDYQDFSDDRIYSYFDFGWGNHSKTFAFYLTAAYSGEYYFPGIRCESMYNMDSYSLKKGMTVEVIADR
jgi:uncharacterized protein YfaS (alpha-2-macroglobulin family)